MISYDMIWYVMICYVMIFYDIIWYVMIWYDMICHVISCHHISCRIISCYAMLCHVNLCYFMWCKSRLVWTLPLIWKCRFYFVIRPSNTFRDTSCIQTIPDTVTLKLEGATGMHWLSAKYATDVTAPEHLLSLDE